MIKVQSHSLPYKVANPAVRGQVQTMINVVFTEEGRMGANKTLQSSAEFLDSLVGTKTGLSQVRTHTQPVLANTIDKYPLGKEFPGHINRTLYSQPQIQNQVDRAPRMIDGRPTFFVTDLATTAKDDIDNRLPVEVAAVLDPQSFTNAQVSVAEVVQLSEDELNEWAEPKTTKAKRQTA